MHFQSIYYIRLSEAHNSIESLPTWCKNNKHVISYYRKKFVCNSYLVYTVSFSRRDKRQNQSKQILRNNVNTYTYFIVTVNFNLKSNVYEKNQNMNYKREITSK